MLLGERLHEFTEVIDFRSVPMSLVGERAYLEFAAEVGLKVPGHFEPPNFHLPGIDPESFESALALFEETLGPALGRLRAANDRSEKSPTPSQRQQGVMRLIRFVEEMLDVMRTRRDGDPDYETRPDLLAEAMLTYYVIRRWQSHPAWENLAHDFATLDFEHTLMVLALAGLLVDVNNSVGLHVATGKDGAQVADLWVELYPFERLDIELKAPQLLRAPSTPLSMDQCVHLIENKVKKSKGQRSNVRNTILAFAGYHLGAELQTLKAAANTFLQRNSTKWSGLAGIILLDLSYQIEGGGQVLRPDFRFEWAPHPGFNGDVNVFTQTPPARN